MGGKWLNLLKEIAPGIKRTAFMFNPDSAPAGGKYFLASFEAAAGAPRWQHYGVHAMRGPQVL